MPSTAAYCYSVWKHWFGSNLFRVFLVFEHVHIALALMALELLFETLVSKLSLCFVRHCSSMSDKFGLCIAFVAVCLWVAHECTQCLWPSNQMGYCIVSCMRGFAFSTRMAQLLFAVVVESHVLFLNAPSTGPPNCTLP